MTANRRINRGFATTVFETEDDLDNPYGPVETETKAAKFMRNARERRLAEAARNHRLNIEDICRDRTPAERYLRLAPANFFGRKTP